MQQSENQDQRESTSDTINKWNEFSDGYSANMAPNFEAAGLQMFNVVGGRDADTIFEAGCGEGTNAVNFCLQKKKGSKLICSDIADRMCKIAGAKFDAFSKKVKDADVLGLKQFIARISSSNTSSWTAEKGGKWDDLGVEVYLGDNEDLTNVIPESNFVDCYISSLSLHIVNDPMKMLKEALRVLKPGKRAIFSVWGNEEDSTFFTLVIDVEKSIGVKSDSASYFRMKDRSAGIKLLEDAGFVDVLGWEQVVPYIPVSAEKTSIGLHRYVVRHFDEGSEGYNTMLANLVDASRRLSQERKFPIALSMLMLMGTKPQ
jgi:ubiquinone/menaquinone biosynthesis C-methylase UbiE